MTHTRPRRASWLGQLFSRQETPPEDEPENQTFLQGFEWNSNGDGKHWDRLHDSLQSLKSVGIDNIWLPPGCKATGPGSNGYDIYDLYDLGEFSTHGTRRTKWGEKEQLQRLATKAQEMGIGLYWDAVLNHRSGADRKEQVQAVEVDPRNRLKEISKPFNIDAWVGFDFPARGDAYSKQKYNQMHFTAADWDDASRKNGIYRFAQKRWAPDVNRENGNADFLLLQDVDLSHPEVVADTQNWGVWITRELDLRGFRLDAAKHMSARYMCNWVAHLRRECGQDVFIKMGRCMALIDDPLYHNFAMMSRKDSGDLRRLLHNSLVSYERELAVTFVESHDTQAGRHMQHVLPWFKPLAYALILLGRAGYPCVFFGDLYGRLDPHGSGPSCSGKLPTLILARKLFAYGRQESYFDARDCIGFVRRGARNRPGGLACIMSNARSRRTKRMFVGQQHAGETWNDLLEISADVKIDEAGYGMFGCDGRDVSVFVNREAQGKDRIPVIFDSQFYN